MTKDRWKIKESATDWECDWKGDERFHLRYFRALSMTEKIRAVEEMCRVADALAGRRKVDQRPPGFNQDA
jgi:hypothetical protein